MSMKDLRAVFAAYIWGSISNHTRLVRILELGFQLGNLSMYIHALGYQLNTFAGCMYRYLLRLLLLPSGRFRHSFVPCNPGRVDQM